jgi:hypothetical protein
LSGFKKLVACLLVTVSLVACTASFTYNQLDWLIPWYVEDYIDLSRDQRKLLRGHLTPVLQWHREEELSGYIVILDRIESDLAVPVQPATVRGWIDEATAAGQRVEESMLSVALDFGASVSPEQMDEFAASLRKQQREYEEEFLDRSDEEYVTDNHENLVEFIERFTGRLDGGQKQRLFTAAGDLQRFDGVWLQDRENWLNRLEPLLQRPPGWQSSVQAAYMNRETSRSSAYREILDHNLGIVTAAVADLMNGLSDRQRQRVTREINNLRSQLEKLISQSRSA